MLYVNILLLIKLSLTNFIIIDTFESIISSFVSWHSTVRKIFLFFLTLPCPLLFPFFPYYFHSVGHNTFVYFV